MSVLTKYISLLLCYSRQVDSWFKEAYFDEYESNEQASELGHKLYLVARFLDKAFITFLTDCAIDDDRVV